MEARLWRTWQRLMRVNRSLFWQLANMRAIARDYAKYGEDLWQRFKRGKDVQSWYYHAAVKAMSDLEFDAEAVPFYKEFEDKVNQVLGYEE